MEEDEKEMAGKKKLRYHVRKAEREMGARREKRKPLYYCNITEYRKKDISTIFIEFKEALYALR